MDTNSQSSGYVVGGIPGRDSVPATLTPGELVLNSAQQQAILSGGPHLPEAIDGES